MSVDLAEVRKLYTETRDCVDFHGDLVEVASWVPELVSEVVRMRGQVRRLKATAEECRRKLAAVRMVQTWRNEDGKDFVLADDLHTALHPEGDR